MSSEINQVSTVGGSVRTPQPATAFSPVDSIHQVDLPVMRKHAEATHKQVDIQFDAQKSRQNVKEAVTILNDQMSSNSRGIGFTVNETGNTPIVTVRNTHTGEVVRQIPNEVVIKLAQGLESSKGALHNKQV
jgi:flagellar protein FlaG